MSGVGPNATIAFAPLFGSHMVLQQAPARARVFGTAVVWRLRRVLDEAPHTMHTGVAAVRVLVSVSSSANQSSYQVAARLVSDAHGKYTWEASLDPTASGAEWTIRATVRHLGHDAAQAEMRHVAFGDVWLCAGQSNMQMGLASTFGGNESVEAALAGWRANIRLLMTDDSESGASGLRLGAGPWATARQHAALLQHRGGAASGVELTSSGLARFCATCYYFAEALSDRFARARRPVPTLGLVCAAEGATFIEQFFPRASPAHQSCKHVMRDPNGLHWTGDVFERRIAPFVRMSLKGWLWQQGEFNLQTNALSGNSAGGFGYGCVLPALIRTWRELWPPVLPPHAPLAPFGVATLAPGGGYWGGRDYGGMRWAQTANHGVTPNPAMPATFSAQAYDLADPWAVNQSCATWRCCALSEAARAELQRRQIDPKRIFHPAACAERTASLGGATVCDPFCAVQRAFPPSQRLSLPLHSRLKRPIGQRLAQAAFAQVYGGGGAATGPTLAGCTVDAARARLLVRFNRTALAGEALQWRRSAPSMFEVLRAPESWCMQPLQRCKQPPSGASHATSNTTTSCGWRDREWWCPAELLGHSYRTSTSVRDVGEMAGVQHIVGPMLAHSPRAGDVFEKAWEYVDTLSADARHASIELDLRPLRGALPHAVRFVPGASIAACMGESVSVVRESSPTERVRSSAWPHLASLLPAPWRSLEGCQPTHSSPRLSMAAASAWNHRSVVVEC